MSGGTRGPPLKGLVRYFSFSLLTLCSESFSFAAFSSCLAVISLSSAHIRETAAGWIDQFQVVGSLQIVFPQRVSQALSL